MSKQTKAVSERSKDRVIRYVPFMADDAIELSISIVRKFIAVPTKSGKLPSDADCVKFMMLCKARALNPWEGDAFLVGYDTQRGPQFSLITAHQALLKRAEACETYEGMESGITVRLKDGTIEDIQGDLVPPETELIGGWARVYRSDRRIPTYRRVDLAVFNTGRSRWEKDPAGMIVKCAEADALRSTFPNKIGGMYTEAEGGRQQRDDDSENHDLQTKLDEKIATSPASPPEVDEAPYAEIVEDHQDDNGADQPIDPNAFDVFCADREGAEDQHLIQEYMKLKANVSVSVKGFAQKHNVKVGNKLPTTFAELLKAHRRTALLLLYEMHQQSKGQKAAAGEEVAV